MSWWQPEKFSNKRIFLEKRAVIMREIRSFFEKYNFTEVTTPSLQICPVMDAHIHAFKTELQGVDLNKLQDMYLHTSPEFDMKKLLSAGMERIYQICQVYRNAEGSDIHSPEFTLLEWYRSGSDYNDLIRDCKDLLRYIAKAIGIKTYMYNGVVSNPFLSWDSISVCEAFEKYADIDLENILGCRDGFAKCAQDIGVRVISTDSWEDIFHAVMAEKIEPNLGQRVPAILYDYPISMASLSRKKPEDPRFAERFELYVCGVEIANAFSELTDAKEQRMRFEKEMEQKSNVYGNIYPPDEEFFLALEFMPQSAGIALGIDRLIMIATNAKNIEQVQWATLQYL